MLLAIDQGTTGTTCLVVDGELRIVGRGYREIAQHFPQPGWVEHDPTRSGRASLAASEDALREARLAASELDALGIANQRETTVVWERASGAPVQRAIVWQDRRTAERCPRCRATSISERTGLVPDPYFSATKLEWLLERDGPAAARARVRHRRHVARLEPTGGAAHVTDVTNASRTLLFAGAADWDDELLALFGVERASSRGSRVERASSARRSSSARACRSQGSRETSRPLSSGRAASRRSGEGDVRDGQLRAREHGHRPLRPPHGLLRTAAAVAPGRRHSSRSRAPCWSAGPRCSGCATGSA